MAVAIAGRTGTRVGGVHEFSPLSRRGHRPPPSFADPALPMPSSSSSLHGDPLPSRGSTVFFDTALSQAHDASERDASPRVCVVVGARSRAARLAHSIISLLAHEDTPRRIYYRARDTLRSTNTGDRTDARFTSRITTSLRDVR